MTLPPELQGMLDKVKDSGALPYLISGGAGALAGGGLAAASGPRKGESRMGRLSRILGSAALAGGATAGAHKLFETGTKTIQNALPTNDVSPEQEIATGPVTRGAAGLAAGGAMAGVTHRNDKKLETELSRLMQNDASKSNVMGAIKKEVNMHDPGKNQWKQHLDKRFPTNGFTSPDQLNVNDPAHKGIRARLGRKDSIKTLLTELGYDHSGDGNNWATKGLQKGTAFSSAFMGDKLGEKAFVGSHSIPGRYVNAKNKIMPLLTKFTGRSLAGVLGRGATIGAATMYPEIIEGAVDGAGAVGDRMTSQNE